MPPVAPQIRPCGGGLRLNDAGQGLFLAVSSHFCVWRGPRAIRGLTRGTDVMLYHPVMNASHHHHDNPAPKLSRNQSEILSCLRQAKEPMSAYAILDKVRIAGIFHP